MSQLLNTGLDAQSLGLCVKLCESGVNPEALACLIKEVRAQTASNDPTSVFSLMAAKDFIERFRDVIECHRRCDVGPYSLVKPKVPCERPEEFGLGETRQLLSGLDLVCSDLDFYVPVLRMSDIFTYHPLEPELHGSRRG
ncbi:hypothetical protein MRX96_006859 [Rhipicephalus microplus]